MVVQVVIHRPLPRDLEHNKPVKARFWPCLEPFFRRKSLKPFRSFLLRWIEVRPMQHTPSTVEVTARDGLILDQVLAEMTASPGGPPTRDHEQHGGGTRLP